MITAHSTLDTSKVLGFKEQVPKLHFQPWSIRSFFWITVLSGRVGPVLFALNLTFVPVNWVLKSCAFWLTARTTELKTGFCVIWMTRFTRTVVYIQWDNWIPLFTKYTGPYRHNRHSLWNQHFNIFMNIPWSRPLPRGNTVFYQQVLVNKN